MPSSKLPIATLLAVALVLSFACGDSDSSDNADQQPGPEPSEAPGDTGGAGSGSATLTIGSESWTVTGLYCAFSPEDAGNERVSFTMSGYTETAEGVRVQFHATIMDPEEQGRYEGKGVIHIINIETVEDVENPAVHWSVMTFGFGPSVDIIQVDGKRVTAEAMFDNSLTDAVVEKTPGTLEGICP